MLFRPGRLLATVAIATAALAIAHTPNTVRPVHADDQNVSVSMITNTFAPKAITVTAGTTVTWVNNEDPNGTDVTHDVMADDYTSWSSAYIDPGGSYSYTFATPGTYHYVCDLHSLMEGTVIVQ